MERQTFSEESLVFEHVEFEVPMENPNEGIMLVIWTQESGLQERERD